MWRRFFGGGKASNWGERVRQVVQIGKTGNYLRGRGSGIGRVLGLGCKQVGMGAWGEKGAGGALVDKGLIVRLSELGIGEKWGLGGAVGRRNEGVVR